MNPKNWNFSALLTNWKKWLEFLGFAAAFLVLPEIPNWLSGCTTDFCVKYGPAILKISVLLLAWIKQHQIKWDPTVMPDRREN